MNNQHEEYVRCVSSDRLEAHYAWKDGLWAEMNDVGFAHFKVPGASILIDSYRRRFPEDTEARLYLNWLLGA